MLNLNKLSVEYQGKYILQGVNFCLQKGKIACILGESGSGKTTLLRSIAQLTPYQGEIKIDQNDIAILSEKTRAEFVGFIFQNYNLFPHLNVFENCINPLVHIKNMNYQQATNLALAELKKLGIEQLASNSIQTLSGGQQQRVAIARTLCVQPKLLLCDEPTAALDNDNIAILQNIFEEFAKQGNSILFSTHNLSFAKRLADEIYIIKDCKIFKID